jgi:hypothetical protein
LLEPNRDWILNVKGAGLDLRTAGLLTGYRHPLVEAMVNGDKLHGMLHFEIFSKLSSGV